MTQDKLSALKEALRTGRGWERVLFPRREYRIVFHHPVYGQMRSEWFYVQRQKAIDDLASHIAEVRAGQRSFFTFTLEEGTVIHIPSRVIQAGILALESRWNEGPIAGRKDGEIDEPY